MLLTPEKFHHWKSSVESLNANVSWDHNASLIDIDDCQPDLKAASFE
jgi:outer membrane cobalamin receptor